MKPKGNCHCGKKATVVELENAGDGLIPVHMCKACYNKARELAKEILEITGMTPWNVAPWLRPDRD